MKILAVDTALGACSVAVLRGDEILAHRFVEMARGHAEALAPMVADAMTGIAFDSLDRLAVTTGPGTFTGQRVGLAFMRGLRIALHKPLTGITTLEAMAAAAVGATWPWPASPAREALVGEVLVAALAMRRAEGANKVAAIHDAKRDEAYLSLWDDDRMVFEPTVMPFAEAVEKICSFGPCALAGTGAPAAAAVLGDDFPLSPVRQPDALWVARLALARPASDEAPAPLYLRAPDAKLPASASA